MRPAGSASIRSSASAAPATGSAATNSAARSACKPIARVVREYTLGASQPRASRERVHPPALRMKNTSDSYFTSWSDTAASRAAR
eukprot:922399-Prorocentrum_minimum.AAC.1